MIYLSIERGWTLYLDQKKKKKGNTRHITTVAAAKEHGAEMDLVTSSSFPEVCPKGCDSERASTHPFT